MKIRMYRGEIRPVGVFGSLGHIERGYDGEWCVSLWAPLVRDGETWPRFSTYRAALRWVRERLEGVEMPL